MANEYWKKKRVLFFPEIEDWSGPHTELRKCPDKSIWHIFFFDIRIYALIQYVFPTQLVILGTVCTYIWRDGPGIFLGLFLILYFGWQLRNTIVTRKVWYGTNLYDMLLRDEV